MVTEKMYALGRKKKKEKKKKKKKEIRVKVTILNYGDYVYRLKIRMLHVMPFICLNNSGADYRCKYKITYFCKFYANYTTLFRTRI